MNELLEIFKKQELDQKRLNMKWYDNMPLNEYHYTYYLKVINESDKVFGYYYQAITVFHNEMLVLDKTHKFCEQQKDNNSMFPKIEKML